MKGFVSVDMEGTCGLLRWADVSPKGIDFARNRSLMTADANAAVEGAFAAGATEDVVEENDGVEDLCVRLMDEIDPRWLSTSSLSGLCGCAWRFTRPISFARSRACFVTQSVRMEGQLQSEHGGADQPPLFVG